MGGNIFGTGIKETMNKNKNTKKYWKAVCAVAVCMATGMTMQHTAQAAEWNDIYYTKEQESFAQKVLIPLDTDNIRNLLPEYLLKPFFMQNQAQNAMIQTLSCEEEELSLFQTEDLRGTYVYANVHNYVNVRKGPSTEYECVGKLYADAVAVFIAEEGDWTHISSGSVTGYIKSEYLLFGEEAEQAIQAKYKREFVVTCNILNLRADAGTEFDILGKLQNGMTGEVLSESEEWAKVKINGTVGYVSKEFIRITSEVNYAVSAEEEAAREAELRAQAEAEAARKAKEKAAAEAAAQKQKEEADQKIALGTEIAQYAIQFEGNPYVWGGTSLTNGADCSGFVYAVYRDFGYTLVRSSKDQAACSAYQSITPNTVNLQPGDLVFYASGGVVDHVALYIGNGKVIQASTPKDGIVISKFNYRTPHSAKRVL